MSIPNVTSLSKIIQNGSEGGLEFARIMNLLIREDSELYNYDFQVSSDASGDFKGVDAIKERGLTKSGIQYKFMEGDAKKGRSEIKKSLLGAIEKLPDMDEWILITPDNFTTHGMDWLEELSKDQGVIIRHWGHNEILNLMLKFPHIGKKYYPEHLFHSVKSQAGRKPTKAEINDFFNQFNDPNINSRDLFLRAQPTLSDFKLIFVSDIYKEVNDGFNALYGDVFDSDKSLDVINKNGPVIIKESSIIDMKNGTAELPRGMIKLFEDYDCFQPNTVFYTLRVGEMYYCAWCFVSGRWVFIPKPWRVVRHIYDLKKDKDIKRLIKWLRWLGFKKILNQYTTNKTKMIVNRVINDLT